jgi:hypothetical protein
MSSENEKIITKKARQMFGSQGEFCRKHGYAENNFSSFKKRAIDRVENIISPLGLELIIKDKEVKQPIIKSDEAPV